MKILFLANHAYVIYKFRYELVMSLLDDNNDVYLSSPYGEILDELIDKGCKYFPVVIDRTSLNPLKDIYLLWQYYRLFTKVKPDIVLTYTIKPNIYGGIISSFLGIPYICTITGLGSAFVKDSWLSSLAKRMYRFAMCKSKMVFFQNTDDMNRMLKNHVIFSPYTLVNGSGVNINQFDYIEYPKKDTEICVLYVGRLKREKGIFELCEAAKLLYDKNYKNIKIKAIGFCEENIKKDLMSRNLTPNIELLGDKRDVREYISKAHVIVLPSYQEGMSNALLEAASCGRPLIATNIPGCREIIDNKVSGFLIEPQDAEALANAIAEFFLMPYEEKKEMGIRGRSKVARNFNREDVVRKYKEVIYSKD